MLVTSSIFEQFIQVSCLVEHIKAKEETNIDSEIPQVFLSCTCHLSVHSRQIVPKIAPLTPLTPIRLWLPPFSPRRPKLGLHSPLCPCTSGTRSDFCNSPRRYIQQRRALSFNHGHQASRSRRCTANPTSTSSKDVLGVGQEIRKELARGCCCGTSSPSWTDGAGHWSRPCHIQYGLGPRTVSYFRSNEKALPPHRL